MLMKALGFAMSALPGVAGFLAYGMSQTRNMSPLASASLGGAAFAATDIAMSMLSGGLSGLTLEQVGALNLERIGAMQLNPRAAVRPALSRSHRLNAYGTVDQSGRLGYLVPQRVGACFGTC